MVRAFQIDKLKSLFGIRRIDRIPNALIRYLCGVKNRVAERTDEMVLEWFEHVQRMENNTTAQKIHKRECVDRRPVGRPQKS